MFKVIWIICVGLVIWFPQEIFAILVGGFGLAMAYGLLSGAFGTPPPDYYRNNNESRK